MAAPTSNATRRLPTRTSPIRGRNLLLDVKQLDANTTFQPSLTQFGQTRLGCRRGKTSIKRPQIRERYRDTDTRSRARLSRCQPRSLAAVGGRLSPSRCPRHRRSRYIDGWLPARLPDGLPEGSTVVWPERNLNAGPTIESFCRKAVF